MNHGIWISDQQSRLPTFADKAYQRQNLAVWDAKWAELSVTARHAILNVIKGPLKKPGLNFPQPAVSSQLIPPPVLAELVAAGFVKVQVNRAKGQTDKVMAVDGLYDFATRVRAVRRHHLLNADLASDLHKYIDYAFHIDLLAQVLSKVLEKVGIAKYAPFESLVSTYVINHRWPGWVARSLKDPLAQRVLDVVLKADGPIPLAELASRLTESTPEMVRSTVDKLISHLALVEDLQPDTWEIMVGFLPFVRKALILATQPRKRPELIVCDDLKLISPDGSVIVDDLRAILLEVASDPPRLRQDQSLFQKEFDRFKAALNPLPIWMMNVLRWSDDSRLENAIDWAFALHLVNEIPDGKTQRLQLLPKGHQWLAGGMETQYNEVFKLLIAPLTTADLKSENQDFFFSDMTQYSHHGTVDTRFLGDHVTVLKIQKGKKHSYQWEAKLEDNQALRKSLDRALSTMEPGVFYRIDSLELHLVFAEHNPLNLGLPFDQVDVYWDTELVPAIPEQRELAGRLLLDGLIVDRLIPLGCVQAALDNEDQLHIARKARFDAYFGREVAASDMAPAAGIAARVVVQPDFSVVVIGLNPAPIVELAPFCERTTQGGGQGAMVLKITRESVVKAVSQGLKPAEIVDRLQRHTSHEVPANVLRQVQDWSKWVRIVTCSSMTILRCPDRETADRVVSTLKRSAERLNDTLVAIDQQKLSSADRTRLRSQGVIVQTNFEAGEAKAKSRSK